MNSKKLIFLLLVQTVSLYGMNGGYAPLQQMEKKSSQGLLFQQTYKPVRQGVLSGYRPGVCNSKRINRSPLSMNPNYTALTQVRRHLPQALRSKPNN